MPDPQAQFKEAIEHLNAGRNAEGHALLDALHREHPDNDQVRFALGKLAIERAEFNRALELLEPLADRNEYVSSAGTLIVHALGLSGRVEESRTRAHEFLAKRPTDLQLTLYASAACSNAQDYEGADRVLDAYLKSNPNPDVAAARSSVLINCGRCDEAVDLLRSALKQFPDNINCLVSLANAMNYVSDSREESFARHHEFGRRLESSRPVIDPLSYTNPPDPDRPLRIAILSADMRAHSVSYFIEAFLRHHDHSRFHITVFSTSATEDAVTRRLRGFVDDWQQNISGSPRLLAREVWRAKPDVVIELGGLTGNSPVDALVPQVAPVQITAIGYPNTTGLRTIQYRIVDSLTDPPGVADAYATERLVRLDPCFLCFTPRVAVKAGRADDVEHVVFGSFNKIGKYSDACLRVWSLILQRVPQSRLLLKSPAIDAVAPRQALTDRLRAVGAPMDRVELVGKQIEESDHMAMYNRIDIAVDPFPYNGTTTTCEALMMGVPVIALEGATHASRVGLSLLTAAGFPELVARSAEQYVEIASRCAAQIQSLRSMREDRSQRMLTSTLCDGAAYAARWENAIRLMWKQWCERKMSQSSPSARR
ncbi:MAG: hypothetical protein ACREJD_14835 [Phycisphaerales bacterium]